jgi:hypothetical protein
LDGRHEAQSGNDRFVGIELNFIEHQQVARESRRNGQPDLADGLVKPVVPCF